VETAGNWRKSSYSGADGNECVEVASATGTVVVRDTQDRNGRSLSVPASTWRAFVAMVK
jgi:hypothetical protein